MVDRQLLHLERADLAYSTRNAELLADILSSYLLTMKCRIAQRNTCALLKNDEITC